MIAYRSAHRFIQVRPRLGALTDVCHRLAACGRPTSAEMARTLLMEIGELESGIVDALCPNRDQMHPVERQAREVAEAAGRLFGDAVRRQRPPCDRVHHLYQAVCALRLSPVPERVSVSVAEGYAYYALYPDAYLDTARALASGWPRGTRASVVGLRSIGTSLSAAVAAGVEASGASAVTWTVRPRGHPSARELRLSPDLTRAWTAASPHWWLVVDEGPGLSGSSLAAAARAIASMGVDRDRIILVPHWRPDIETFAPDVRAVWERHRVAPVSEAPGPTPAARARRACAFFRSSDWSGGRWRAAIVPRVDDWPAVHPAHERLKWHTPASPSSPVARVIKFAGLGAYGRDVANRAQAAAEAHFAPPVLGVHDGWIETAFIEAGPVDRHHVSPAFVDRVSDYLVWLDAQPPAAAAADWRAVEQMTIVNVRELLGGGPADTIAGAFAAARPALEDRPPRWVDGRLFPHEWIAAGTRYWKTDAAEHADDHFFPGPLDVAWDVAAVLAEFEWPRAARAYFVARHMRLSGDRWLAGRLPICSAAYLGFRAGYASLASASVSDAAEAARFAAAGRRYTAQLKRAVDALTRTSRRGGRAARRAADRDRPA